MADDNFEEDIFADLYDNDDPSPAAIEAPSVPEARPVKEESKVESPPSDPAKAEPSYDGPDDSLMNDSNGGYQGNGNGGMNGYGSNDHNEMMGGGDDDSYGAIGMKEDG